MFAEHALRIELYRQGVMQVLEVQADRALVGSGAHCDLRLMPDEAAVEQLTIEARDDEVVASVRALEPAVRLNGAPFLEGRLSPDALLEVSGVTLRVTLTELKAEKAQAKRSSSQTHPVVQGLGLLGVAFGLYYVLDEPVESASVLVDTVSPPALFASAVPSCTQRDAEAARAVAEQDAIDAESKAERAPFYPSDGLAAVQRFESAAACYRAAGDTLEAEAARRRADTLKRTLEDELHLHHLRLERLLVQAKYVESAREVRVVSEFIADRSHPYAHWLAAVKRELEIQNDLEQGG